MIHTILKMGDLGCCAWPRPWRISARPSCALVADMFETMAAAQGVDWPRRRSAWTCNW